MAVSGIWAVSEPIPGVSDVIDKGFDNAVFVGNADDVSQPSSDKEPEHSIERFRSGNPV